MLEIKVKTAQEVFQAEIDEAVAQTITYVIRNLPEQSEDTWDRFWDGIPMDIHTRVCELLETN